MITASVVTYDHHLLDFEPVLRSLFASPVDVVYVIDHSEHMFDLCEELQNYAATVLKGEPQLQQKVDNGFRLLYYKHENNGYGGGHNYAMQMAQEEGSQYHLVVNPDVWFGPEVIPTLIAHMVQHPEVGQMMPRIYFPNGENQRLVKLLPNPIDMFGRLCLPQFIINRRNKTFELQQSQYNVIINAPYLSGCFMLFRMSAFIEVGRFDERFFMYAEDIDITRRMHRKYQTLFYPEVRIYHKFNRQSHRSLHLFWIHTTNIIMYFNKYGWWKDRERKQFNHTCLLEVARTKSGHAKGNTISTNQAS